MFERSCLAAVVLDLKVALKNILGGISAWTGLQPSVSHLQVERVVAKGYPAAACRVRHIMGGFQVAKPDTVAEVAGIEVGASDMRPSESLSCVQRITCPAVDNQ